MSRIAIIQHQENEDEGTINSWLADNNFQFEHWRIWQTMQFESPEKFTGIIVLGGEFNVREFDSLAWMQTEYKWLQQALNLGIPCFGICLGAQILANILGAKIFPLSQAEIGVKWLEFVDVEIMHFLNVPGILVNQAHSYRFDIPRTAKNLATSNLCDQQLFWDVTKSIIGIQCHLEWTQLTMEKLFPELATQNKTGLIDEKKNQSLLCFLLTRVFTENRNLMTC